MENEFGVTRNVAEQEDWDLQTYGCLANEFISSVKESITFKFSGLNMVLMSLLSDAQEEIVAGRENEARQTINRAKLLLSRSMANLVN